MSKTQILRSLVTERLTAAAEEIFVLFERTLTEYEGEIDRQRKLLHVLTPGMRTESLSTEVLFCEEEVVCEQQERSPSLDQEESQPPQIKEEQEELWSSQEGEQLQGLEEAEVKWTSTPVPVKREHDEEEPQCSWFNQSQPEDSREAQPLPRTSSGHMDTQPDGDHWATAPQPARTSHPAGGSQPTTEVHLLSSDSSGAETEDSDEWGETRRAQSGLKMLKAKMVHKGRAGAKAQACTPGIAQALRKDHTAATTATQQSRAQVRSIGRLFKGSPLCGSAESSLEHKPPSHISADDSGDLKDCAMQAPVSKTLKTMETQEKVNSSKCNDLNKPDDWSAKPKLTNQILSIAFCKVCGISFPDEKSLCRHVMAHPSDCGLCGKRLVSTESLRLHLEGHGVCTVCGEGFCEKLDLLKHMRGHGGGFQLTVDLQRDLKSQTGESRFTCSVCGKGFSLSTTLKIHMRTHSNEKPFICPVCGKRFREKDHVKSHMRIHSNEKPFSCPVCGKGFRHSGNLTTHLRTHSNEKPFTCPVCGKAFSQSGNLKAHMRIHSNEKPFSCSICGKWFRHSMTVKKHMKTHLNNFINPINTSK